MATKETELGNRMTNHDLREQLLDLIDTMESVLDETIDVLERLQRGDCWCGQGIGNPMYSEHTTGCQRAKALYDKLTAEAVRGE